MYDSRQVIINITIAALLCLTIFSYQNFLEYRRNSRSVEHSFEVLNSITALESRLNRFQALRREHTITNSNIPLLQIRKNNLQLHSNLDTLKNLISDNIIQTSHINHIINSLDSSGIYDFEKNHLQTNQTDQSPSNSKLINLDKVYQYLDQMKQVEGNLMNIRAFSKKESEWSLPALILITGAAALAILFYTFFLMNKELQRRLSTAKELEANIRQLNIANEELERFAFIASHNLKEPIRKARTALSRIQTNSNESPQQTEEKVSKSDQYLLQLQDLLDDLLIYTRLLNQDENKELVSLEAICQKAIQSFSKDIKECGAHISVGQLPEIPVFSKQILLLFEHLISNSIRYQNTTKRLEIKISGSIDTNSKHFIIDFEDNGIGFDLQYLQKIFEVFGRLHSRDEYKGTGIGLAICRRVMANHNGFINAESEPGQGARFSLYFPIAAAS